MNTYKEKIKIAVVAPPFSGHLYPILELVLPLLNKKDKYDICVYTGFKKKEVVERLGFPVKILLEDRPDVFENISDTDKKTNPIIAYKQFKENLGLMPKIIKEMEDYFSEEKPDIIVADFIAVPVCFVSKKLNIPWITSIPTPFAIENKTTTPAYVGGLYPRDSFIFKLRDKFARGFIRAFKKLLCFILRKQLKELKNIRLSGRCPAAELKEFKKEKLEQSENPKKQSLKINFTNPLKKSKDKKIKKKRTWVKVLTNLFLLVIMLLCSFAIFAVNGFNMIADKEYLARVEELQNLSEKSNGLANLTSDYMFIQFFSKNSNTIMLFSLILLIVITLLVFILNMTIFKRKKGEQ